jgi:hypothetical protein
MKMNWSAEEAKDSFDEGRTPIFLLSGSRGDEYDMFAEEAAKASSILRNFDESPDEGMKLLSSGNCILLLPHPSSSLALLAAFAALMGIPSAAVRSALMDETLGKEGYVHLPSENSVEATHAIQSALGEGGRSASAFARRNVTDSFPPEKGARKLKTLYISLGGDQ